MFSYNGSLPSGPPTLSNNELDPQYRERYGQQHNEAHREVTITYVTSNLQEDDLDDNEVFGELKKRPLDRPEHSRDTYDNLWPPNFGPRIRRINPSQASLGTISLDSAPELPPRPCATKSFEDQCSLYREGWPARKHYWKLFTSLLALVSCTLSVVNLDFYVRLLKRVQTDKIPAGDGGEKLAVSMLIFAITLLLLSISGSVAAVLAIWRRNELYMSMFQLQLFISSVIYFCNLIVRFTHPQLTSIVFPLGIMVFHIGLGLLSEKMRKKMKICECCY
ncbi:unnamed protein product, partial [Mesorhabditis belari]|uniref:Uncharacterized protein n=1 Tax=Mesorhabditis belari TaxID=2138241 RepID=A0AAF3EJH0_9BILA